MSKIKVLSSMAFDAVCFLESLTIDFENPKFNFLPEQQTFRDKIDRTQIDKLKDGLLGMSGLCAVISAQAENKEFENYTIYDLAEFFRNPENLRQGLESGAIWASDKRSPEEWAYKYLGYIDILKDIKFEKLWESELLPFIQAEVDKGREKCKSLNMDAAFADIQRLKQGGPIEDVKIYISFMSYPVAFKIHGNSYVNCVYANVDVGIICHELMHGVTNKELEGLYLEYVKSIKYLTEQHDRLLSEWNSGNEEEFVAAAEYYLRMKHNGENKKDLLKHARNHYGGAMPTSVFLFDLLSQEAETPSNYAQWLTDVFNNKKLPKKAIERNLNNISPRDATEKMFDCFKKMLLKVQEIQKDPKNKYRNLNIEKKIEQITNKKFEEISDKSVYFAQERQVFRYALKVKEMQIDGLFINIAEYQDMENALKDGLMDAGSNMWCCDWHQTNFSCIGKTPATTAITFVKNNLRISVSARCPDYVNRNMDFPSKMIEYNEYFNMNWKRIQEEGITTADIDRENGIIPLEEFMLEYAIEILTAQKKIEDIIMKL